METQSFGTPDLSSWEVAFEHDPVSRRSGRARRAAGQADHGYADDRKAPDLRRRTPPRDRGHRRRTTRSDVALDEIAEIIRQRHTVDIATCLDLAGDLGRNILHPVFERVERDHLDGIVEAASDELADRGFEIAP